MTDSLEAPSSKFAARYSIVAAALAWFCGTEIRAQNMPFSTHDWTENINLTNPFVETWADVKTPGGVPRLDLIGGGLIPDQRRTYCVGTIEVETTGVGAEFSDFPADPDIIPPFNVFVPLQQNRRQIAILQCNQTERGTDGAGANYPNGIEWQRYFYGLTFDPQTEQPDFTRSTNARAISVWEAADPEDARVAICGETYDQIVPESQAPAGWAAANGNATSGYIAVYNGDGDLLWTHHFFAGNDPGTSCAVTDLSIRVDGEGRDIVTYCGIFTHGDPGLGTELSPELPFDAPAVGLTAGDTVQAGGEWDGFVGRLVRENGVTDRVFHSIVGGEGQDGLFGLAEIDVNRFAVVGSTEAEANEEGFPIAVSGAPILVAPYRIGAVLVFDATATPGGDLVLDQGAGLGAAGGIVATHARDVCVGVGIGFDSGAGPDVRNVLYVVGSTSDPAFETTVGTFIVPFATPPTLGQATFGGNTDGFVAVFRDIPGTLLLPHTWSYWGDAAFDGLTGVNCWNEFPDHVGVAGFTGAQGGADIGVSTFFLNTAYGPGLPTGSTAPANNLQELQEVRAFVIPSTSDDRPAVMGLENATDVVTGTFAGGAYDTFGLGQSSGGGIAVANDGRIDVVGRTNPVGGGYPVVGSGRQPDLGIDAVRTELDMVPQCVDVQLPGVGRTDGTGWQGPGAAPAFPVFPIPGFSGGTTPACGLSPFGFRVGEARPPLQRMLIDYEGAAPDLGVTDAAIVVSRPPILAGSLSVGVLWFGFPLTTGPNAVVDGVEFWANPATWVLLLDPWPGNRPYRVPLAPLPTAGTGTVSVQLNCLLNPTPGSGPLGFTRATFGAGCAAEWAASPAIWFSF